MTETVDKSNNFLETLKSFWQDENSSIQVVGRGILVKDAKRITRSNKFKDYLSKSKKFVKAKNE